MKSKLFISQLENVNMNQFSYLKEQIECTADNSNLRNCTKKVK